MDPVQHLRGLRGKELALGIVLTPLFVPIWILGWVINGVEGVREWWWNR